MTEDEFNAHSDEYAAVAALFDEDGNFVNKHFDPYRAGREGEAMRLLFEEDFGVLYLRRVALDFVYNEVGSHNSRSDIAALYHASIFASNTKGNYSVIYYWR